MKYALKIPAISGDIIALCHVAEAMARAASTAYGKAPPHEPIFKYQLPIHIKSLLSEALASRLIVCNQIGYQGTAEEIIDEAKSSGDLSEVRKYLVEPDWEKLHRENPPVMGFIDVWDFTAIDLGPTEIDWDTTNILCLYSKLHHLNEWGKTRGDEFSIADECAGWIDERGYMNATIATNEGQAPAITKVGTNEKAWDNSRLRALLEESILPGVTKTSLGVKYGVSRQRISTLLKDSEDKFRMGNSSPPSLLSQPKRLKY